MQLTKNEIKKANNTDRVLLSDLPSINVYRPSGHMLPETIIPDWFDVSRLFYGDDRQLKMIQDGIRDGAVRHLDQYLYESNQRFNSRPESDIPQIRKDNARYRIEWWLDRHRRKQIPSNRWRHEDDGQGWYTPIDTYPMNERKFVDTSIDTLMQRHDCRFNDYPEFSRRKTLTPDMLLDIIDRVLHLDSTFQTQFRKKKNKETREIIARKRKQK